METIGEVGRCCFCGSEDLHASESHGLRERLLVAVGGLAEFRCASCQRRFAALPLHSGRRRHRQRKRRSLEERLEPSTADATPRWMVALAILVIIAAVLGGLVWAEHGFAPFSSLQTSPSAGVTP